MEGSVSTRPDEPAGLPWVPPLGPTATLELTPEPAQWGRRGPQSRHTVEEGRPPGDASRRVRDPSRQTSRPFPALGPETLRSLPTSRTQPRRQPDGRPHAHTAVNRPRLSVRVPRARSFVTCSSSNPHVVPSRPRVHGCSTSLHLNAAPPRPLPTARIQKVPSASIFRRSPVKCPLQQFASQLPTPATGGSSSCHLRGTRWPRHSAIRPALLPSPSAAAWDSRTCF